MNPPLALTLASTALLAACGSPAADQATQTTAPTPAATTPTGPPAAQTYGTLTDLRDAAITAGHPCPTWVQDNVVKFAAESGHCDDADVLATYATQSQLDEAVATMKALNSAATDPATRSVLLVGPNWTINAPDAPDLQTTMGGTVLR